MCVKVLNITLLPLLLLSLDIIFPHDICCCLLRYHQIVKKGCVNSLNKIYVFLVDILGIKH